MNSNPSHSDPAQPSAASSADGRADEPFVSLHTAVVLLTALVVGLVVGGLTALNDVPVPGAVLAGLVAAGSVVSPLRSLIGPARRGGER